MNMENHYFQQKKTLHPLHFRIKIVFLHFEKLNYNNSINP